MILVAEWTDNSFAGCDAPDGSCVATKCDESGRVGEEINTSDDVVNPPRREDFVVYLSVPTMTSPQNVPAAIHLPSLEKATHWTCSASIVAKSLPSSTRHT